MEKKFKPFDKVIARFRDKNWMCDLYSHYNPKINRHVTLGFCDLEDDCILPYEGNEELVGTTDEPDEEVRLEEGELILVSDWLERLGNQLGHLRHFKGICGKWFKSDDTINFEYAIRFSDFNPNDMEETKKHILCVKNGKIIRFKSN